MAEEKNISEKNVEKKSDSAAPVGKELNKKKSTDLRSLVATVVVCLLVLAVILIFLNGQRLNKQVVELQRNLSALQTGEKVISHRVAALEDEFVVLDLKHRLNKISNSRKDLTALKTILADNPDMVVKVQELVDGLGEEQKRLESEISSSTPKEFKGTRSLHGALTPSRFQQPAAYQCCPKSGKCLMLPNVPASHPLIHPVPVSGGQAAVHSAPKAVPEMAEPQSGWSKFINMRLFGN